MFLEVAFRAKLVLKHLGEVAHVLRRRRLYARKTRPWHICRLNWIIMNWIMFKWLCEHYSYIQKDIENISVCWLRQRGATRAVERTRATYVQSPLSDWWCHDQRTVKTAPDAPLVVTLDARHIHVYRLQMWMCPRHRTGDSPSRIRRYNSPLICKSSANLDHK